MFHFLTRGEFARVFTLALLLASSTAWKPVVVRAAPPLDELRARARAVLSPLDGQLAVAGLREPVEVTRDRWGIAHINARNQHDLFVAQGYIAAQDRLFQLELWRRAGRGENAELFGPDAVEGDRFARLLLYRGDWEAEWASYSPDAREIADAFVTGINAAIDATRDRLPIEFQLAGIQPQKWRREDIVTRMSGIVMCGNWQREIARARLIHAVGLERARQIAPTDPPRPFAFAPGLDSEFISTDLARGYLAATRAPTFQPPSSESNNWVVDGTWSQSGRPMLAGDPHRTLALPSLRYLVHLRAPGWNVIGSGEPALPGVAIGHNERIAWAFTIVNTDQVDGYVEETKPDDPRQYRAGETWVPMRSVRDTIRVRGEAAPREVELRFTRHGPVIYQDEMRHRAYALRWTGLEPGGAAYLGSLALGRAQNRDEFLRALSRWKIPALNFVYADVEGTIGWVAAGLTPRRAGWDGLLPVPGAAGQFEWQGYLAVSDYPQHFNPSEHWLATANHKILPPDYPHEIGYEFEAPFRYDRIRDQLTSAAASARRFSIDDFQRLQHDSTSLAAQQLTRALADLDLPAELSEPARTLVNWNGELARNSAPALLYAHWLQELADAFFTPRLPPETKLGRGTLRQLPVLIRALREPTEAWWGPEPRHARDTLLRSTLAKALTRTRERGGPDPSRWRWDQAHVATFRHPLGALGATHAQLFNLSAVARAGDATTPNNTRHNDQFEQIHGASYRHIFDLADWDRAVVTSAPGQSGQPESPHYADLLPLWGTDQYFPLAFSPRKIAEVAAHRLQLRPAKE